MLYFLQQFARLKANLQLEVAFRTTIRAHLLQNCLYRAELLYIIQQRRVRGGI